MKVSNALLTFTIATAYSANAAPSLEPPHAEDTLSEQPAPVPTSLVVQEIHVFPEIHMIPEDKDKDATKPTEFLKRSLPSFSDDDVNNLNRNLNVTELKECLKLKLEANSNIRQPSNGQKQDCTAILALFDAALLNAAAKDKAANLQANTNVKRDSIDPSKCILKWKHLETLKYPQLMHVASPFWGSPIPETACAVTYEDFENFKDLELARIRAFLSKADLVKMGFQDIGISARPSAPGSPEAKSFFEFSNMLSLLGHFTFEDFLKPEKIREQARLRADGNACGPCNLDSYLAALPVREMRANASEIVGALVRYAVEPRVSTYRRMYCNRRPCPPCSLKEGLDQVTGATRFQTPESMERRSNAEELPKRSADEIQVQNLMQKWAANTVEERPIEGRLIKFMIKAMLANRNIQKLKQQNPVDDGRWVEHCSEINCPAYAAYQKLRQQLALDGKKPTVEQIMALLEPYKLNWPLECNSCTIPTRRDAPNKLVPVPLCSKTNCPTYYALEKLREQYAIDGKRPTAAEIKAILKAFNNGKLVECHCELSEKWMDQITEMLKLERPMCSAANCPIFATLDKLKKEHALGGRKPTAKQILAILKPLDNNGTLPGECGECVLPAKWKDELLELVRPEITLGPEPAIPRPGKPDVQDNQPINDELPEIQSFVRKWAKHANDHPDCKEGGGCELFDDLEQLRRKTESEGRKPTKTELYKLIRKYGKTRPEGCACKIQKGYLEKLVGKSAIHQRDNSAGTMLEKRDSPGIPGCPKTMEEELRKLHTNGEDPNVPMIQHIMGTIYGHCKKVCPKCVVPADTIEEIFGSKMRAEYEERLRALGLLNRLDPDHNPPKPTDPKKDPHHAEPLHHQNRSTPSNNKPRTPHTSCPPCTIDQDLAHHRSLLLAHGLHDDEAYQKLRTYLKEQFLAQPDNCPRCLPSRDTLNEVWHSIQTGRQKTDNHDWNLYFDAGGGEGACNCISTNIPGIFIEGKLPNSPFNFKSMPHGTTNPEDWKAWGQSLVQDLFKTGLDFKKMPHTTNPEDWKAWLFGGGGSMS